jgi:LuxR family transcriptional regulator, maltose regulon positive regulatory protein
MAASHANGSIAKITRPRITGVFSRTRLFKLLDEHLEYPAAWISASAGSGKTTLVASYLAEKNLPSIWYQMDEGDGDIATFFYYTGRAAAKAAPRKKPLPLLTPEYLQGINAFTARYFENLYSRLKTPFVIVFDNCQLIPSESLLYQVLCTGMEILPEGVKVICISREDPPAQFARLRANNCLRAMDSHAIQFTVEESGSLMRLNGFEGASEETAQTLHVRTGGWAAGLMLMLEQARVKGLDSIFSSELATEQVFDYFANELFKKIDTELKEFFVKTSFLPKMTVAMARELTGNMRSNDILNYLYKNHFFTQRDTQAQPFYQYHPLFREFLKSRVNDLMTEEQVLATRRTSARILEQAGQTEDAVAVLAETKDWENLIPLILANAQAIVQQGRSETLEGWLKALPPQLLDEVPWLHYWLGICRMNKAPLESYVIFKKAFHFFKDQHDFVGEFLSWSGTVNSLIFTFDDYALLDAWVDWLDTRLKQGVTFFSPEIEANVASSMAGALVWRFLKRHDVKEWLDRASTLSQEVKDESVSFLTLFHLGTYYYTIGDFANLQILTQKVVEEMSESSIPPLYLIFIMVGKAHSLPEIFSSNIYSINFVREGLTLAEKYGVHLFDNQLSVIGCYLAFDIGDFNAAEKYLHNLTLDLEKGSLDYIESYNYCLAWYYFFSDNINHAKIYAEQALQTAVKGGGLNNQQFSHHLLAVILQSQKEHEEALHHLLAAKTLIPKAGEGYYYDFIYTLIEADIYADTGQRERTLKCLRHALFIGRQSGYKSIFFYWQTRAMARLCAIALEHGIEVEYVRELITALRLPADGVPSHMDAWPWPVKIYTLGKFELYKDGKPVQFQGKAQKKPLQMLMAMIASGGVRVKNERLKDLLWPEAEGDKAQSAFTSTLSRLRSLMGNDKAITVCEGSVSLDHGQCWVDAWAFEKLADMVEAQDSETTGATGDGHMSFAEKAIKMYGGAFLSGEDHQPWVAPYRENLTKRFSDLVMGVGDQLEKTGRQNDAAKYFRKAIDIDEITDEEPYQRLMAHYTRKDQRTRAVEVYMKLKRVLDKTLGIKPSLKTEAVYKSLIR